MDHQQPGLGRPPASMDPSDPNTRAGLILAAGLNAWASCRGRPSHQRSIFGTCMMERQPISLLAIVQFVVSHCLNSQSSVAQSHGHVQQGAFVIIQILVSVVPSSSPSTPLPTPSSHPNAKLQAPRFATTNGVNVRATVESTTRSPAPPPPEAAVLGLDSLTCLETPSPPAVLVVPVGRVVL
ncbi:hypothetical protein G7046_g6739 [Stylonectria norvegica]|nr:hypothetical protein G7046_g6739 [Stylonectria norvegica]